MDKVLIDGELLPCPFCGDVPELPSGNGTQYEIECGGCGQAMASVQICDLMTIEERTIDNFTYYRYSEQFVERAKNAAIEAWNRRTIGRKEKGMSNCMMPQGHPTHCGCEPERNPFFNPEPAASLIRERARLAQPAEAEGASALDDLLALFPLKIDKQAFVVNGGSPLTADGDDEFLSFKKVDAALGEIRQLSEQGRAALSAVTAERDRLDAECGRLLEGKIQDAETIYILESERDQLRAEVEALRAMAQRANTLLRQIADSGYDDDSIDALTCWLEENPGAELFDRVSAMAAKEA